MTTTVKTKMVTVLFFKVCFLDRVIIGIIGIDLVSVTALV